jgi:hypothetical protein
MVHLKSRTDGGREEGLPPPGGQLQSMTAVDSVSDVPVVATSVNNGRAARSLRSRPFAGDGFGLKSIEQEGGSGSRPSAGPAAREALGGK